MVTNTDAFSTAPHKRRAYPHKRSTHDDRSKMLRAENNVGLGKSKVARQAEGNTSRKWTEVNNELLSWMAFHLRVHLRQQIHSSLSNPQTSSFVREKTVRELVLYTVSEPPDKTYHLRQRRRMLVRIHSTRAARIRELVELLRNVVEVSQQVHRRRIQPLENLERRPRNLLSSSRNDNRARKRPLSWTPTEVFIQECFSIPVTVVHTKKSPHILCPLKYSSPKG